MSSAKETRNHDTIRKWAESHKGSPAIVDTDKKGEGILRIKFSDDSENLKEISWKEFFEIFDEHELTFLYQDERKSRFNKLVYQAESTFSHKK